MVLWLVVIIFMLIVVLFIIVLPPRFRCRTTTIALLTDDVPKRTLSIRTGLYRQRLEEDYVGYGDDIGTAIRGSRGGRPPA